MFYIILIFRYSCFPYCYLRLLFLNIFFSTFSSLHIICSYRLQSTPELGRDIVSYNIPIQFYENREASACTFCQGRMWPHFVHYTTLTNDSWTVVYYLINVVCDFVTSWNWIVSGWLCKKHTSLYNTYIYIFIIHFYILTVSIKWHTSRPSKRLGTFVEVLHDFICMLRSLNFPFSYSFPPKK